MDIGTLGNNDQSDIFVFRMTFDIDDQVRPTKLVDSLFDTGWIKTRAGERGLSSLLIRDTDHDGAARRISETDGRLSDHSFHVAGACLILLEVEGRGLTLATRRAP
jgi:hypothetical protein